MSKYEWARANATSPAEAAILRAVEFWWPRATARRDGTTWMVKTVAEFQRDHHMEQWSESTIRRAMARLKRDGILRVEVHRHPFNPAAGRGWWLQPVKMTGSNMAPRQVPTGQDDRFYIEQDNGQDDQAGQLTWPAAPATGESEMPITKGGEFLAKKRAKATIAGAMEAFSTGGVEDHPAIKTPTQAFHALRDAAIAAGHPTPGSFNPQVGGMLKTFVSRCGQEGLAPNQIGPMLFMVCARWGEFVGWAKSTLNVSVGGTSPNVKSITTHAVPMVGFWRAYGTVQSTPKKAAQGAGSKFKL